MLAAPGLVHCRTCFFDLKLVLLQGGRELELLKGITGAFRPGVLTALMGAASVSPVAANFRSHRCSAMKLEKQMDISSRLPELRLNSFLHYH